MALRILDYALTVVALLLTAPAFTWADETLDVKPGLWEVTWVVEQSGFAEEQLARMTPAQRQRIEDALRLRATTNKNVDRACITEQRARALFGEHNPGCRTTVQQQTANALEYRLECLDTGGARTSEVRMSAAEPDHVTGTMETRSVGPGGKESVVEMSLDARWLQDSCEEPAEDEAPSP